MKRPCPQLPPLIQGSIHVQGSEGSGLGLEPPRAVYQCWFGLVLEPAESEVRYCIQGKWTGENPQCGKPFSIFQKNRVSITIKASSPSSFTPCRGRNSLDFVVDKDPDCFCPCATSSICQTIYLAPNSSSRLWTSSHDRPRLLLVARNGQPRVSDGLEPQIPL